MEVLRPPVLVQGKHSMWKHKFSDMQTTGLFGDAGETIAIGENALVWSWCCPQIFLPSLSMHFSQLRNTTNTEREAIQCGSGVSFQPGDITTETEDESLDNLKQNRKCPCVDPNKFSM